jgi:O-antigen/teichoic acid export membrane protein
VAQAVADRGLAIGLGFASLGAWGLFIGRWAAPLIPIAMLRRKAVAPDMGRAQAPKGRLLELARRYKDFPLFTTWSLIFTNLSQEAPVLLLGLLYDPAAAGLLALAARVVRVPLTTVGDAIHKVYMQQAAEMMDNPGLLKEKTLLLAKVLCLGMSPLLLVLGILGRPLFGAVFGQAWGTAGLYCQYLAVYFFTLLLYRPLSVHFSLMERQRLMFGVTIGLLAARVGSLLAVHLAGGSVDTAVGVLGAVSGLAMLATVLVLLRTIGITFAEAGRLAARIAILAAPLAVCLSALAASGLHPWVLVSAAAVLTAAQAALAVFVDKELRRLLSRVLGARRDPIR